MQWAGHVRPSVCRRTPARHSGIEAGGTGLRGEHLPRGDPLALRKDPLPPGRLLLCSVVQPEDQVPQSHLHGQSSIMIQRTLNALLYELDHTEDLFFTYRKQVGGGERDGEGLEDLFFLT